MELILTLKLYLDKTEVFNIELFWHSTVSEQNLIIYNTELLELEFFD